MAPTFFSIRRVGHYSEIRKEHVHATLVGCRSWRRRIVGPEQLVRPFAMDLPAPHGSQKRVRLPHTMDECLALLLGMYASEGHTNSSNYTMNFSQTVTSTNVNQALAAARANGNPQFGYAPLKEGRRILELGLRFDF